jgi:hypothetical protein
MVDPLGGDAGGPEAPTIYLEDVDDSSLEVMTEVWERPPPILKMLMADPWEALPEIREHPPLILKNGDAGSLRGDAGDPGAPTT